MDQQAETVEITVKEYNHLLDESQWLCALESAGVDNWQGIDMAYEILDEWKADDGD